MRSRRSTSSGRRRSRASIPTGASSSARRCSRRRCGGCGRAARAGRAGARRRRADPTSCSVRRSSRRAKPRPRSKTLEDAEAICNRPRAARSCWSTRSLIAARREALGERRRPTPSRCSRARISSTTEPARVARSRHRAARARQAGRCDRRARSRGEGRCVADHRDARRARARARERLAGARPLYERALADEKDNAIEIAIDWAASELAGGDPTIAVTALEKTAPRRRPGRSRSATQTRSRPRATRPGSPRCAPATARRRSSCCARRSPSIRSLARRCDLAVAAVASGDATAALTALKAVDGPELSVPAAGRHAGGADPGRVHRGAQPEARREGARSADRARRQVDRRGGGAARHRDPRRRAQRGAGRVSRRPARARRASTSRPRRRRTRASATTRSRTTSRCSISPTASVDRRDRAARAAVRQGARGARQPRHRVRAQGRSAEGARCVAAREEAGVRFAPLPEWIEAKERIYGEHAVKLAIAILCVLVRAPRAPTR